MGANLLGVFLSFIYLFFLLLFFSGTFAQPRNQRRKGQVQWKKSLGKFTTLHILFFFPAEIKKQQPRSENGKMGDVLTCALRKSIHTQVSSLAHASVISRNYKFIIIFLSDCFCTICRSNIHIDIIKYRSSFIYLDNIQLW